MLNKATLIQASTSRSGRYRWLEVDVLAMCVLHYSASEKFVCTRGDPGRLLQRCIEAMGTFAEYVGKGAQFQLGLPAISVESVVVPDRTESFALRCESVFA